MPTVHNKYHGTAPEGAVYIGRPSKWGNPFDVKTYGREEALMRFGKWVFSEDREELRAQAREELRGKDLVCFCKPKSCHGDVWLSIANTPMPSNTTGGHNGNEERKHEGAGTTGSD